MKTALLLLMMTVAQYVTAQKTATLSIVIENIANNNGEIMLGMSTQENFMKSKPDYSASSKIENGKATITFKDVPHGIYAISCFQDINGNNQMDFEINGMPKEDYGISNNPMLMGPPTWEDAKFEISQANKEIVIRF